jgi:hypothetical protein
MAKTGAGAQWTFCHICGTRNGPYTQGSGVGAEGECMGLTRNGPTSK